MPLPSDGTLPSPLLLPGGVSGIAGQYTHSFPNVRPGARFDGNSWLTVTVAESSTRTGTYTDIVSDFTLDPADTDPTSPLTRDITVTGATLPAGWYRFTFTDGAGESEVFDPIYAGPGIRPTVADVARRMPDRTTVDGGADARTFNADTSPTAEEVEQAIDDALDVVDPRVPPGATPEVERAARQAVTLEAALAIESGNWGEQVDVNDARVALWERLLASYYATLDAAANQDEPGQARFGSVPVLSPTLTSYGAVTGFDTAELLP